MRDRPERLKSVLRDYLVLTNSVLSTEEELKFFDHEAVRRLSMHESPIRIKAGEKARKVVGKEKYELLPSDWIDAVYELSSGSGDRVWVTRGGFRFHETRECKALADGQSKANSEGKDTYNPQYIKRDEATRYGKKPCLVCKPNSKGNR